MEETRSVQRLNTAVKTIERYIIKTLIALMSVLLIIATLQLAYMVVISILQSDVFILDLDVLMDLFGVFLLVLIGIELLDTIKVYFKKHDIHVEVVMLVALIAIARKIILMDFDKYSGFEILGIAAIVISLALGYYFIKKAGGCGFWPEEKESFKHIVVEEKEYDPGNQTKILERKKVMKEQSTEQAKDPDPEKVYEKRRRESREADSKRIDPGANA